jgi:hypothetical protein
MKANRTTAGETETICGLSTVRLSLALGAAAYSCRGMLQLQANAPPKTHSCSPPHT